DGVGLYIACELTSIFGYDNGLFGEKGGMDRMESLITKEAFEQILGETNERIARAASDGSLAIQPSFTHIIAMWSAFGHEEEAVTWLRQNAVSDRFLVS